MQVITPMVASDLFPPSIIRHTFQPNGFPMILESPLEVGEMKLVQLTESRVLASEGARMRNCVANFVGSCASGSAYIFSVRDKDGASCVTVEYRLDRSPAGLPELNFIQQKGFENSTPDSRYNEALAVLHRYATSPFARRRIGFTDDINGDYPFPPSHPSPASDGRGRRIAARVSR